ncbi:MAG: AsmA family protein, partial [Bacteroidota bacterium]
MEQQKKHTTLKKWSLRLLWVCLVVFLLGLVLRLSLKTEFVQNQARNYLVKTANSQLNGKLSIERISGDLWKEVTLSGIVLHRQDTLARVDSIHTAYNLWALVDGKIEVSELQVYQPNIDLQQYQGRWNMEGLVAESSDTTESETTMMPFQIDSLTLDGGDITVQSDSLPVGSVFAISDLQLASSLGYQNEEYNIDLDELSFRAQNDASPRSVNVETAASFAEQQFSLEQLVIAAGESVVRASGNANAADSALQFELSADPITWQDAADYIEEYPLREDVNMSLSIGGKPEQFDVTVSASGNGLEGVSLQSQFSWQQDLVIQQIHATAEQMDLSKVLADTTYPSINNLDAQFEGSIAVTDFKKSKGDYSILMSEVVSDPYRLDRFSAEGSVDEDHAALTAQVSREQQMVEANISAENIWDELPTMRGQISGRSINPGFWMQDTTLNGDLAFNAEFSGKGWYPQEEPWQYGLRMERGEMMGHPITDLNLRGRLSADDITTDGSLNIRDGVFEFASEIHHFSKLPLYSYQLQAKNIDMGPLLRQEDFSTNINGIVSGEGRGFDPADMQLKTSVLVDSSVINGETIRELSADLSVDEGVARVDSARLGGTIADGAFSLRMNLVDYYEVSNELFLDLDLKDLSPFAPLVGADTLQATGEVTGTLRPAGNQELRFLGQVDLSDLAYDQLFIADSVRGLLDVQVGEQLNYLTNINLNRPSFSGIQFQRINLITEGNFADRRAVGSYDFQFSSPNEGRIEQGGSYELAEDSARIETNEFNIVSD